MNYSFWYKIFLYKGRYPNSDIQKTLYWDNLTWEVRIKWTWYFEYRAALLQVQNPKCLVEQSWGKREITDQSPEQLQRYKLNKRKTTLKKMITQFTNAINKYESEEQMKLIPNFDNHKYLRTVEKLKEYKSELLELE